MKISLFDDFKDTADTLAADKRERIETEDLDLEYETIPFGKHRYKSILELAKADCGYIDWMLKAYASGDFDHPWIGDNEELLRRAITVAAKLKAREAPPIKLTDHQRDVVTELMDAIAQGLNIVRLEGGAGYGKSYATAAIAKELGGQGLRVRATAVSYVATHRRSLRHARQDLEVRESVCRGRGNLPAFGRQPRSGAGRAGRG